MDPGLRRDDEFQVGSLHTAFGNDVLLGKENHMDEPITLEILYRLRLTLVLSQYRAY